eukprot:67458-Alexandrium_andersonii.AAC.1
MAVESAGGPAQEGALPGPEVRPPAEAVVGGQGVQDPLLDWCMVCKFCGRVHTLAREPQRGAQMKAFHHCR